MSNYTHFINEFQNIFNLDSIGLNSVFQYYFDELNEPSWLLARISSEDKGSYSLVTKQGETRGKISGSYRYQVKSRAEFPVVGDWVAVELYSKESIAVIHKLLPRKSTLSRKVPGENIEEQPIAANIDFVFIVAGLDNEFNLRRIERYLTLVWNSGAQPVIILNKNDLLKNTDEKQKFKNDIEAIALEVPTHFISSTHNSNLDELKSYFKDNQTVALLGSSGVGKSTLTNSLLGKELQKTMCTRASDSKGRHTTTRRQLFILPSGGVLIDTPGIRELQLWIDQDSFNQSFSDIETIAQQCRFSDCTHIHEPGCAVQSAIANNELDLGRLRNYQKLQREISHLAKKQQETSWDCRLEKRKHGKLRHQIIKQKIKPG